MCEYLKISIVIPSFNQGEFIGRTLNSIVSQRYPNIEIIVLDGGSQDNSVEVIKQYSTHISFWRSHKDNGQTSALSDGFTVAKGDIFAWLNSDDILLPGSLFAVNDHFINNKHSMVATGGSYCIDANDELSKVGFGYITEGVRASYRYLLFYGQDGVFQPATFWRSTAYWKCGGIDLRFNFAMDRDLFIRLALIRRFDKIPSFLSCFRLHGGSKSHNLQATRLHESQLILLKYPPASLGCRRALFMFYRVHSIIRKIYVTMKYMFKSVPHLAALKYHLGSN